MVKHTCKSKCLSAENCNFFKLMHLFLKLPLERLEGTFDITGIKLSLLFMHGHCIQCRVWLNC